MPDSDMALQGREHGFVEHLGHQAHVLVHDDARAVTDRYASRLLAPVLQCVQPEVGELRDFLAGSPHPEHAARVPRRPVTRIEIIRQPAIGVDHALSLVTRTSSWDPPAPASTQTGLRAGRWP